MSKDETKRKIIEALAHLIATKGFQNVGVNAIAREAKTDKVLIYRYFENLPNLLKTFAKEEEFWPSLEHLLGPVPSEINWDNIPDILIRIFTVYMTELINRPKTQAIMCWELIEQNELTDALSSAHEEQGLELLSMLPEMFQNIPDVDVAAVLALIHSGISYMVLRSRTAKQYAGIDLDSKEGW